MSANNYYQNRWYEGQKNLGGVVFIIHSELSGNKYVGYTTNSISKRFNQYWSNRFKSGTRLAREMREGDRGDFIIVNWYFPLGSEDRSRCIEDLTSKEGYFNVRQK